MNRTNFYAYTVSEKNPLYKYLFWKKTWMNLFLDLNYSFGINI